MGKKLINRVTGAELLIKSLLNQQVEVIFGYPGGAIMPVYDALFKYKNKIRHVLVRHEQGAAHAAEGYARISGKPGVCFATSGPGATNLVTGLADAMMDSIPLVCVTGQVASSLLGTDAFQEVDIIGISTPVTKWNYQVTKASEIPQVISQAFAIATSGRPGPVLIDFSKDAQFETINQLKLAKPITVLPAKIDKLIIKKATEMINSAQKPLILAGHGVGISKAEEELKNLAEKADIPVACTLHGLSYFPSNHPLFVGMLGMHGNYAPNMLTNQADLIVAVGMRFDDRVTGNLDRYAKQAKIIHIEIDNCEINKNVSVDLAIKADAKEALAELSKQLNPAKHSDWLDEFAKYHNQEQLLVINQEVKPKSKPIKMAEVVNLLSQKSKGEAIIVADVGQHQMISARYYMFNKSNSFLTSGGAGTMGFALPAAIGAKIAQKDREVIAVIGDGSFQMTIQELATINQEKLPVKVIILNNNYLGMVRQWQELFFDQRYSFVDLQNPDFIQVAKGFFLNGEKVKLRKDLAAGINRLLNSKKAYILEVEVEKEGNVFPMISTGAAVDEVRLF